jgi:hypothetical protein
VSASTLWRAIAVVQQRRALPSEVSAGLGYAHHRALFPVRDAALLGELAARAVMEEATPARLARWVRERVPARPGRPASSAETRAWARLEASLVALRESVGEGAPNPGRVKGFDACWRAMLARWNLESSDAVGAA